MKVQIICAPHELSNKNYNFINTYAHKLQFTLAYYPNKDPRFDSSSVLIDADIIVINTMGILAELYALGDCAFIGGALHYQVHNVLEPLAHDIPIAHGNLYRNSHEAITLVKNGIAKIITTPQQMLAWFLRVNNLKSELTCSYHEYLNKNINTSKTIYQKTTNSFIENVHD
jgi:3-deoxy-D-manno-octulosonic-acid transferase